MSLQPAGHIELPTHLKPGGFDHAAVHRAGSRLYAAHTGNDALDVIDCENDRYLRSIPGLTGVAGALVSEERDLVFTSNRGENTVGLFHPDGEAGLLRVRVGLRPNGLAFDPTRNLLLAANVGDPAIPNSFTVSIVDVEGQKLIADIPGPGRTRWAVFDSRARFFYVNIADPPEIILIHAQDPTEVAGHWPIPASGPHGLDLDAERSALYCACDGKKLFRLATSSGRIMAEADLGGVPDVIFLNPALHHLYVAIGDPGVIEVFDTNGLERIETVESERGAHTLAIDPDRNKVYAFLPMTHRAAVFIDE